MRLKLLVFLKILLLGSITVVHAQPYTYQVEEGDTLNYKMGYINFNGSIPFLRNYGITLHNRTLFANNTFSIRITEVSTEGVSNTSDVEGAQQLSPWGEVKVSREEYSEAIKLDTLPVVFLRIPKVDFVPDFHTNKSGYEFDNNGILTRYEGVFVQEIPCSQGGNITSPYCAWVFKILLQRLWPPAPGLQYGLITVGVIAVAVIVYIVYRQRKRKAQAIELDSKQM